MPVTGARKPMRNSSEYAVEPRLVPTARQLPNSSGLSFRIKAFIIVLPPDVVSYFRQSGHRRTDSNCATDLIADHPSACRIRFGMPIKPVGRYRIVST